MRKCLQNSVQSIIMEFNTKIQTVSIKSISINSVIMVLFSLSLFVWNHVILVETCSIQWLIMQSIITNIIWIHSPYFTSNISLMIPDMYARKNIHEFCFRRVGFARGKWARTRAGKNIICDFTRKSRKTRAASEKTCSLKPKIVHEKNQVLLSRAKRC